MGSANALKMDLPWVSAGYQTSEERSRKGREGALGARGSGDESQASEGRGYGHLGAQGRLSLRSGTLISV